MNRTDLAELHFIAPLENVRSILERGVLSNDRAAKLPHRSIALQEVQDKRHVKQVPGTAKTIHAFANVYLYARNTMLFKRRYEDVCVLRVDPRALDLPGAIIADQNAVSDYARFTPSPEGLTRISRERLLAESWVHPNDQIDTWRHCSQKCAELLVPGVIPALLVFGAYVKHAADEVKLYGLINGMSLDVQINGHIFFA